MHRHATVLSGAAFVAALAIAVRAAPPGAGLSDPTRPPAGMQMSAASGSASTGPEGRPPGAAAGPVGARAAHASASAPAPQPVLQAVQVPSRGQPTAMVDGRLVRVGDSLGERTTVTAIDQLGVTLRGPSGTQRLSLLIGDSKQPPGSIVITRSTTFSPANTPAGKEPRRTDPAGQPIPVLPDDGDTPTAAAAGETPIAVAGKTRP